MVEYSLYSLLKGLDLDAVFAFNTRFALDAFRLDVGFRLRLGLNCIVSRAPMP